MRDRLIKLIDEKQYQGNATETGVNYIQNSSLADHLLENGVIVPPMKLGQACFDLCSYRNDIDECRVSSITQKADGSFKIRLTNLRGKWVFEITSDKLGKTVFLTREEAERALKGGEG